jgi:Na+-driven multidrug efflux pump
VNKNIILQVLLVCMFSLGIVGAAIDDRHLCAFGLVAAFGCAMLLIGRDDE